MKRFMPPQWWSYEQTLAFLKDGTWPQLPQRKPWRARGKSDKRFKRIGTGLAGPGRKPKGRKSKN